ncbi:DUF268 domain-containing protein [Devosia sp.]|uniref:DUF268 domain-containing protein n=1 Tax=Devosia sp. TaxID=1871048 RepID=UPI0025C5D5E4|nr:DUF268 domain-containing protein [Devosia sp.]
MVISAIRKLRARLRAHKVAQVQKNIYDENFVDEFALLSKQHAELRAEPMNWDDRYVCLSEKTIQTEFDRHYIYHPAWAARILATTRPAIHVDISSTLTFCTLISAFIPTEFYDFRPAPLALSGLTCGAADLTNLHFVTDSIDSLSCMHVLEHIGLGRYGDPIDAMGDLKAMRELVRVLRPGGDLLVAVPVGRERVQFNAHRIYDHERLLSYFEGLELQEFALIPDGPAPDGLIAADAALVRSQEYACGCYWFKKPK